VIAARLGKAVSTVSREVAANGGRGGYRAWRAHQRARAQARRPKTPKLACPQLAAQVTTWLAEWWSPQQISRRLRIEFPGDPMMRVSHETIYQALYVQGRGELRRSWPGACAPGGPSAGPAAGAVTPAISRTW
jgi:IS30 family transposase